MKMTNPIDIDCSERAIAIIEQLYPEDSIYGSCAKIGRKLLQQAKQETGFVVQNWRQLPFRTLKRYAELCIAAERSREGVK